jgi:hemolysin III
MTAADIKLNLEKQPIPKYSLGEEVFNWISHAIGIVIGFFTLGFSIALSIIYRFSSWQIVSLIFYSLAIVFLYATSTIYHALPKDSTWKKLFRILDHNTIYLLIAGTYAPICAFAFPVMNYGYIIMVIQAIGLIVGTVLKLINLNGKATQIITVLLYIVMGWIIVVFFPTMQAIGLTSILLILFGGISYTLGVIFYAAGRKIKWMHSVFHLFVLVGTILQLLGIIYMIV